MKDKKEKSNNWLIKTYSGSILSLLKDSIFLHEGGGS